MAKEMFEKATKTRTINNTFTVPLFCVFFLFSNDKQLFVYKNSIVTNSREKKKKSLFFIPEFIILNQQKKKWKIPQQKS